MEFDVVIVGGGPAGLAAALIFGRSRKRAVLFDGGVPRNAPATHVQGFVTRDGTPPAELRAIARAELRAYPSVELREGRVLRIERIGAAPEGFTVRSEAGEVTARRVLLCTGIVDVLPELPGYRELWGKSIFQCPYCHAWECRDQRFAFWPRDRAKLEFALLLRGWTKDLVIFPNGVPVPVDLRAELERAAIRIDERRIVGLRAREGRLAAVQVEGGEVPRDALFSHPPQRQTDLVESLCLLRLDEDSVRVDDHAETSLPGVHAAGDLTTDVHGALVAAAAATAAAYRINTLLTKELVLAGQL